MTNGHYSVFGPKTWQCWNGAAYAQPSSLQPCAGVVCRGGTLGWPQLIRGAWPHRWEACTITATATSSESEDTGGTDASEPAKVGASAGTASGRERVRKGLVLSPKKAESPVAGGTASGRQRVLKGLSSKLQAAPAGMR